MLSLVGDPCAVNPDARLRRHARDLGWRIGDYRTGRRAAIIGVPVVGGVATAAGLAAVAVALERRRRRAAATTAAAQKKTLRRCISSRYSVCWIVSRTWSVRLNTSIGSSAAPAG